MQYDPDAILVYGWNFKSHLQVMRTFSGKKLVFFRGDSTLLDKQHTPFIKRVVKAIALKWIYGLIEKAMYTGAHNKQYFKNYGVPENKLVFMPHTVDNHRFASTSVEDIQAMRDKLNIDSNEIVCLFAGKLEPKKNPELLIQSFLKAAQANSKLIIVGNGILEEHLKKNYHHIPTIVFLPFQNQKVMPAIYAMADIFVLPSQGPEETWGLAVNEAMAAGKPVIVSDKCGCSADIVEQGKNGFVFQSGNADELSAFLSQLLLKNRDQLAQMGKRSQEIIKIWSNENAAEILENVVLNK
jgi:glycosyltransferase involved in cell wall biosynthesis